MYQLFLVKFKPMSFFPSTKQNEVQSEGGKWECRIKHYLQEISRRLLQRAFGALLHEAKGEVLNNEQQQALISHILFIYQYYIDCLCMKNRDNQEFYCLHFSIYSITLLTTSTKIRWTEFGKPVFGASKDHTTATYCWGITVNKKKRLHSNIISFKTENKEKHL